MGSGGSTTPEWSLIKTSQKNNLGHVAQVLLACFGPFHGQFPRLAVDFHWSRAASNQLFPTAVFGPLRSAWRSYSVAEIQKTHGSTLTNHADRVVKKLIGFRQGISRPSHKQLLKFVKCPNRLHSTSPPWKDFPLSVAHITFIPTIVCCFNNGARGLRRPWLKLVQYVVQFCKQKKSTMKISFETIPWTGN